MREGVRAAVSGRDTTACGGAARDSVPSRRGRRRRTGPACVAGPLAQSGETLKIIIILQKKNPNKI